jgi:hypothetical protein
MVGRRVYEKFFMLLSMYGNKAQKSALDRLMLGLCSLTYLLIIEEHELCAKVDGNLIK